jgi:hypothetical protein
MRLCLLLRILIKHDECTGREDRDGTGQNFSKMDSVRVEEAEIGDLSIQNKYKQERRTNSRALLSCSPQRDPCAEPGSISPKMLENMYVLDSLKTSQ